MQDTWDEQIEVRRCTIERLNESVTIMMSEEGENLPVDLKESLQDILQECETHLTSLEPVRVAVVGRLKSGKSRFVNTLIGQDVSAEGVGHATTAVLTEIVRKPIPGYQATVFFRTSQMIAECLKYVLDRMSFLQRMRAFSGGPELPDSAEVIEQDDAKLTAIKKLLTHMFDLKAAPMLGQKLIPQEDHIFVNNIDRSPEILRDDTVEGLTEKMRKFIFLPGDRCATNHGLWESLTVDSIRIEGNFSQLPYGVVLIDSPGLGDAEDFNSERTMAIINKCQYIWLATRAEEGIHAAEDAKFLRQVLVNDPHNREVSVICTKLDELCRNSGREAGDIEALRREQISASIKNILCGKNQVGVEHGWGTAAPLGPLPQGPFFSFTSAPRGGPCDGFSVWQLKLKEIGVSVQNCVQDVDGLLHRMRKRIEDLGNKTSPPPNIPHASFKSWVSSCQKDIIAVQQSLANALISRRHEFFRAAEANGLWESLHKRTLRATMDEARCGVFKSRGQVRSCIDLNVDVIDPYLKVSHDETEAFFDKIDSWANDLRDTMTGWAEKPQGLDLELEPLIQALRKNFTHVKCGSLSLTGLKAAVQTLWTERVLLYGQGRHTPPTEDDVSVVYDHLNDLLVEYCNSLRRACVDVALRLKSRIVPVHSLSPPLRSRLLTIIEDTFENGETSRTFMLPNGFRCLLCSHLLQKPLKAPCGHDFCENCLKNCLILHEEGARCPVDHQPFPSLHLFFANAGLEVNIQWWQVTRSEKKERNPLWWETIWENAVFASCTRRSDSSITPH